MNNLSERLFNLRKSKNLSQEEVAERLDVTRQTISKWETGQSVPDFDKIVPLCELYEISTDELLTGNKPKENGNIEINDTSDNSEFIREKRANGIGKSILLYFISIIWIMITIPAFNMNPIISSAIFLLICGIATYIIVFTCIKYKEEKTEEEKKRDKLRKQIEDILGIITLIIYLIVSFITMAWHITWLIWVVYGLITEILKLVFMLRRNENEQ